MLGARSTTLVGRSGFTLMLGALILIIRIRIRLIPIIKTNNKNQDQTPGITNHCVGRPARKMGGGDF